MILVPIDMPKFCGECYFCTQYHETYPLLCRLTKDTVDECSKPETCPLIEAEDYEEEE